MNQKGERSIRIIEPLRIDASTDGWYLRGYCPIHLEPRNFKLDRMRSIEILDAELSEEAKTIQPLQLMLKAKEGEYGQETQGFIRFETDLADRPEIEVGTVFRLKAPAPAPIVNPASDGSEE
jgi:predicted DNA-binding transcriptional regulator YafY